MAICLTNYCSAGNTISSSTKMSKELQTHFLLSFNQCSHARVLRVLDANSTLRKSDVSKCSGKVR
jgi:hypothetical protein